MSVATGQITDDLYASPQEPVQPAPLPAYNPAFAFAPAVPAHLPINAPAPVLVVPVPVQERPMVLGSVPTLVPESAPTTAPIFTMAPQSTDFTSDANHAANEFFQHGSIRFSQNQKHSEYRSNLFDDPLVVPAPPTSSLADMKAMKNQHNGEKNKKEVSIQNNSAAPIWTMAPQSTDLLESDATNTASYEILSSMDQMFPDLVKTKNAEHGNNPFDDPVVPVPTSSLAPDMKAKNQPNGEKKEITKNNSSAAPIFTIVAPPSPTSIAGSDVNATLGNFASSMDQFDLVKTINVENRSNPFDDSVAPAPNISSSADMKEATKNQPNSRLEETGVDTVVTE
jgi:hypothetical protein